jgi:hypothetical protein
MSLFFMFLAACAVYMAKAWAWEVARFPIITGVLLFFFCSIDFILGLFVPEKEPKEALDILVTKDIEPHVVFRRTMEIYAWIVAFFLSILLLGFQVGIFLFVFLYQRYVGREGWFFSLLFAAINWFFFYGLFCWLLHLPFPNGIIMKWMGLNL